MTDIILCTLNARYSHASLGLRYLQANLGEWAASSQIMEFTIKAPIDRLVDTLLAVQPKVIGLGIYIWNVQRSTELIIALKRAAPQVRIVLGGPEVSHETVGQDIVRLADHVITGAADLALPILLSQLLQGPRPLQKIIAGNDPEPSTLQMPYELYTDEDIRHRHLYVEASRGCPFKCEFCLSALDKTARAFDLAVFLAAMQRLVERGARRFKFVDRTFNLKVANSLAILRFFLQEMARRPDEPFFVHFELVPDHLPAALKDEIARFPPGSMQLEIGIQTWNPEIQARISRRQDNDRAAANLQWLRSQSNAHLHVDLIAGLPGESLESFAQGFDRLHALGPHEIQVGLLKRLRGAPIARHTEPWQMQYAEQAPYAIVQNSCLSATDVGRLVRFARYWDLVANSGRLARGTALLLVNSPFARFMQFSDWLYARLGLTHQIEFETLIEAVHDWLVLTESAPRETVAASLTEDYADSGAQGHPKFLDQRAPRRVRPGAAKPWRQHRRGHLADTVASTK